MPLITFVKMADKKLKLAENKIKPTNESVVDFLKSITPLQKQEDCFQLLEMMKNASMKEPVLWSNSFVGFGTKIHISPATGRGSEWMRIGFAPRKANISLYFGTFINEHATVLTELGKHKAGMGCVYINKLADINLNVLKEMIVAGLKVI